MKPRVECALTAARNRGKADERRRVIRVIEEMVVTAPERELVRRIVEEVARG